MSCENPPGIADAVMSRRRKFDKTGTCIKCKTNPGRLVIRHAVYCKACSLMLISSKFRQVLDPTINSSTDKTQIRGSLKASGNLMIGFSGGLGSTVLLDLVKTCYFSPEDVAATTKGGSKHPRKNGRPWDRVVVCYIECGEGYLGATDSTHDIVLAMEKYRGLFEFLPLRLEDAFKISDDTIVTADLSREDLPTSTTRKPDVSALSLLKAYLTTLPTDTSQEDSVSTLTRVLLQHTARTHGCSHLLLGTSLTSLSVNLINSVASGAGFTVGLEKAEDWQSPDYGMVRVVRSLREISMKECAAYAHWRDLSVVGNRRLLSSSVSGKGSIGGLTKDFIFGLERDYPSTVNAIVRTCDKLVSNTLGEKCVLCERPAQSGIQEWKEQISVRSMTRNVPKSSSNTPENAGDAVAPTTNAPFLTPQLCYACHTTLTSRSSRGARRTANIGDGIHHVPLPVWVGENLAPSEQLQTRAGMREQIQDFLINTDEKNT